MKLKGVFTVEAAVIFSFIAMLIVAIINLDFFLHDSVLNDSCKIQAGVRLYTAKSFYYDDTKKNIDYNKIICSPITKDKSMENLYGTLIKTNMNKYYDESRLSTFIDFGTSGYEKVITSNKNADVLRKGSRAMELLGDIIDEE